MRTPVISTVVALLVGCLFAAVSSVADEGATTSKEEPKTPARVETSGSKTVEPFSGKETAALEFAQQNHPALVPLLQQLKQSSPKDYEDAIVALNKDSDRLGLL